MSWWPIYKKYVKDMILNDVPRDQEHLYSWRSTVFCEIRTYLLPLSVIALIPSLYPTFKGWESCVGMIDMWV